MANRLDELTLKPSSTVMKTVSHVLWALLERHWVGVNQFVMLMILSSIFPTVGYLKQALNPYFQPGQLDSPFGLAFAMVKLVVMMKAPGSTVAVEILPALVGCLMMTLCVIALSQILGRLMAHTLQKVGLSPQKRQTTLS